MNRSGLIRLARLLLGALLIATAVWRIGIQNVLSTVVAARPIMAMGAFLFVFLFLVLGATNIALLLSPFGRAPFPYVLKTYLASWAIGLVTPGKLGDASMVLLLRRKGVAAESGMSVYLADKTITLIVASVVSIAGGIYVFPDIMAGHRWAWFLPPLFLLCALVLAHTAGRLSKRLPARIGSLLELVSQSISNMSRLVTHHRSCLLNNVGVALLKTAVTAAAYHMAFLAFSQEIPLVQVLTITVMSSLVAYIPISFNGLGTVEVCAIHLYGRVGVPSDKVLSCYMLLRVMNYAFAGILALGMKHDTTEAVPDEKQ